jgi:Ca2+-transporting ATPase
MNGFFKTLLTPNIAQRWVAGVAILFLLMIIYIPFLQSLFKIQALQVSEFLICIAAGLISILWFEIISLLYRRKK